MRVLISWYFYYDITNPCRLYHKKLPTEFYDNFWPVCTISLIYLIIHSILTRHPVVQSFRCVTWKIALWGSNPYLDVEWKAKDFQRNPRRRHASCGDREIRQHHQNYEYRADALGDCNGMWDWTNIKTKKHTYKKKLQVNKQMLFAFFFCL